MVGCLNATAKPKQQRRRCAPTWPLLGRASSAGAATSEEGSGPTHSEKWLKTGTVSRLPARGNRFASRYHGRPQQATTSLDLELISVYQCTHMLNICTVGHLVNAQRSYSTYCCCSRQPSIRRPGLRRPVWRLPSGVADAAYIASLHRSFRGCGGLEGQVCSLSTVKCTM